MSLFDFLDDAKYQVNRFIAPVIFLIAGLFLLKLALVPEVAQLNAEETFDVIQNKTFFIASLLFMLGAVLWFLFIFDIIKSIVGYIIMGLMAITSCIVLYMDWTTIQTDVEYIQQYDEMDLEIKVRINDIKSAEVAYKEFYGHYTNNFDTLALFVKTGFKKDKESSGVLPERRITEEERNLIYGDNRAIDNLMSDIEAHCLAKMDNHAADLDGFKRDTVYLPVMDAIFNSDRYNEARSKMGDNLIAFHPDSMRYVPYSSLVATLDTASVMKGEITVSTLMIRMYHPMDSTLMYQIGDTTDNHLRENWD